LSVSALFDGDVVAVFDGSRSVVIGRAVEAMLGSASAILSVISHPRLALSSTAIGVAGVGRPPARARHVRRRRRRGPRAASARSPPPCSPRTGSRATRAHSVLG
jgi:hypothetical protein